jgi:hypothetical protein
MSTGTSGAYIRGVFHGNVEVFSESAEAALYVYKKPWWRWHAETKLQTNFLLGAKISQNAGIASLNYLESISTGQFPEFLHISF